MAPDRFQCINSLKCRYSATNFLACIVKNRKQLRASLTLEVELPGTKWSPRRPRLEAHWVSESASLVVTPPALGHLRNHWNCSTMRTSDHWKTTLFASSIIKNQTFRLVLFHLQRMNNLVTLMMRWDYIILALVRVGGTPGGYGQGPPRSPAGNFFCQGKNFKALKVLWKVILWLQNIDENPSESEGETNLLWIYLKELCVTEYGQPGDSACSLSQWLTVALSQWVLVRYTRAGSLVVG